MRKYILVLLLVFKQNFLLKKEEETERNSGFTEENLLPTRLGSQSKLQW